MVTTELKKMDADSLHSVGQNRDTKVSGAFVNQGIPTNPIFTEGSRNTGVIKPATDELRKYVSSGTL